jgi:NitT/TauT family transport system substrate-binding protein
MADKAGVSVAEYEDFDKGTTLFTAKQALDAFGDRAGDTTSLPEMARRISPFLVDSGLAKNKADINSLFLADFTKTYAGAHP